METIKEAEERVKADYAISPSFSDELIDSHEAILHLGCAFRSAVAWAERWIPVEEELPPIGKNVTILLKGEDENGKETFNVHTFDKITNHKRLKGWFDFYDFTHWRPINHE